MSLAEENLVTANIGAGASSGTINATTSGVDRILLLFITTENPSTLRTVTGIASTSGIVWHKRGAATNVSAFNVGLNTHVGIEEWWAHAPVALTADTATVTLSGGADGFNMSLRAISGVVNFSNPFDSNISLPVTGGNTTTGPNVSNTLAGISTTHATTLMFGCWTSSSNQGNPTSLAAGAGATLECNLYNPNPVEYNYNVAQYEAFSSAQSGITWGFTNTNCDWLMFVDAISDAPMPAAPSNPDAIMAGY